MWASTMSREKYRTEYAELWNSTASDSKGSNMVDVILCPATPSAAPKLDTARYWGYTAQWNLLDYPAIVFPVSQVGNVDFKSHGEQYTPRNVKDEYNWQLWEKYGAEGYKDAPLNLQLVGRRYEDEKVLRALEVIKEEIGLPFTGLFG
jgi:Asp-tRNA(Asn)/Glu-tRNA(Gln) amidotransferase A subunit family amidase